MTGIIKSIIDLDLYKLTMAWAVMQKYPETEVEYEFINRGNNLFREGFDKELTEQLHLLSKLRLTEDEETYLRTIRFLPELFIQFLKGFSYNPQEVFINQTDGKLSIKIKGHWFRIILWETILMSIISELNFINVKVDLNKVKAKAEGKARHFYMNNERVVDMGTRRRFSYTVQDAMLQGLVGNLLYKKTIIGTSNVHFAMKYGIKCIGTVAHEWYMFHGAKYGYKMANEMANDAWTEVYKGDLGICLPDSYSTDVFLKTFDMQHAKLFDGIRNDSGDPIEFGYKMINHYEKLGIDPKTKNIVFSDSLNSFEKVDTLQKEFQFKMNVSFGIGTWLSCDIENIKHLNIKPLNMVIKITKAKINGEWVDTIKLSDDKGKNCGCEKEIKKALLVLNIK